MKKMVSAAAFILMLLTSFTASAKAVEIDATTKVVESIKSEEQINYTSLSRKLNTLENDLKAGNYTADILSASVRKLSDIRTKLTTARKQNEQELQFVLKRIEALGEAPADESAEVDSIAKKRKEFNDEASMQKGIIAETDVLLAKIDELDTLILNTRNQELLGNLLSPQKAIILPQTFFHDTTLLINFSLDIIQSPISWYKNLNSTQRIEVQSKFIPGTMLFVLFLWLGINLRLFIMRHFGYNNDIKSPRFGKKVFAAFLVALAYGVIPASIIAGFMLWLYSTKIVSGSFFGIILNLLLLYSLLIFLIKAFTRVVFAPYNPKWRLVNMETEKAKHITNTLYMAIITIGLCSLLEHIAVSANYSVDLIAFLSLIATTFKGLFMILLTKALLLDDLPETKDDDETDEENNSEILNRAVKISFLTIFGVAVIWAISLFGYTRLSAFIFNRLIFSALIIAALFLLRKLVSEFLHQMLFFKFWFRTFKLRRKVRVSIAFWSNIFLDPIFIVLGIFLLLTIWGVSTDLLLQSMKKLLTGFNVGGVNISLLSIILGIASFFASLTLFKALRTKFINQVLGKMAIDDGIKHSLSAGMGFVSFVLAVIIAIVMMGGNLTNLAIIASALSVGIGFGLQNIINNFVSGIIILFERPFKVGDWVVINGQEGKIQQINIRSTEIETFNKSSVIIPNATLISNSVTNLTHGNNWSRQSVTVGVAYGSDVEKVREILLECAKAHKYVMKTPAPYVLFKDFSSSSLEFELRCYTADIWNGWIVPSDLRFMINKRFIEEGIEIPFPQIVVHSGEKVAQENQFYAKKKAKSKS